MKNEVNYIKQVNIYKGRLPLWVNMLLKAIFITFLICCAFVAVFSFIYICTPVDGPSMQPTINAQCEYVGSKEISGNNTDSVYINRFATPTYGDIIVVNKPTERGEYVIKRLIAKGGDKVAIEPIGSDYKVLLIKGDSNIIEELQEDYLSDDISLQKCYDSFKLYRTGGVNKGELVEEHGDKFEVINYKGNDCYFLKIEEDEIFYLGDNRANSNDCSNYGAYKKSKCVGRVDIIAKESKNNFSYIFLYFWHKVFG